MHLAVGVAPLVVLNLLGAVKVRPVVLQLQLLLAGLALEDEIPHADLDPDAQGRERLQLHVTRVPALLLHRHPPRRPGARGDQDRPGLGPRLLALALQLQPLQLVGVRLERGLVGREEEAEGAPEGRLGPQAHRRQLLWVGGGEIVGSLVG
jgi:hypothetical protein